MVSQGTEGETQELSHRNVWDNEHAEQSMAQVSSGARRLPRTERRATDECTKALKHGQE